MIEQCKQADRAHAARHFRMECSRVHSRQMYVFLGCFESENGSEMFVKDWPCNNIKIMMLNTQCIWYKSRRINAEAMVK